MLGEKTSTLTEPYLSNKFPIIKAENNILINGSISPTEDLVKKIKSLKNDQWLFQDEVLIAYSVSVESLDDMGASDEFDEESDSFASEEIIAYEEPFNKLNYTWDVFTNNEVEIKADFELLTKSRKSQTLSESNKLIGDKSMLFIEEGAVVEGAIINVKEGPVYIGKNAEVMEGALIRGSFALCEGAQVKMGAKIYGGTTVGPHSRAGGELNNVVIIGYSNKAHDGYFGNSVIGEWCNIGADTNTSNLKNTYDEIRLWNYPQQTFIGTGLTFCGVIMGDHVKCGINTMFNTGSVIGVCANVFGSGYQRNFVASYSWGSTVNMSTYSVNKAIDVAKRVWERRNIEFTKEDGKILKSIFETTSNNRKFRF
jgi:UDP-N-acetylglucosamine diphosphorylase/glucosamine-1-phosphate N-acetyltransferase